MVFNSKAASFRALEDFQRARRRATLQELLGRLTGRPHGLLSYEEVRRALRIESQVDRGLQEIPLDSIVGSVGRYSDFNRSFHPLRDEMQGRWARVQMAALDQGGWPPIEVYQIGDSYFVLDGNHRVSVARQLGMKTIEAYVTEVGTKVPLTPDLDPDMLICKAQYAEFLERTSLDEQRPDLDLTLTAAGGYQQLEKHIAVHRHYMGLERREEIPYEEAAVHWYDTVYQPVAEIIRERGLLRDFPDRTETDLYLWLLEHRAELEESLGWEVGPEGAADDLAAHHTPPAQLNLSRVGEQIRDAVVPDELKPGPAPGGWRQRHLAGREAERLFADVLVPVRGEEAGWSALEQALVVARQEGSRVRGLHVVPSRTEAETPQAQNIKHRFEDRLRETGAEGKLVFDFGPVAGSVCARAGWNDLVVLNLQHPPSGGLFSRLGSGLRRIIKDSPRPLLLVPGRVSPLQHPLLAFDGSPKAEEALFLASYMAGRWGLPLTVVVATEGDPAESPAAWRARIYLEDHDLDATFVVKMDKPVRLILDTAADLGCDFILMGGYGRNLVREAVLGSTADHILRETSIPVLICQ